MMHDMQRNLEELKLEHEYQLRLKDMGFTEKLKEITEMYSQEIEGLKIITSVLRTEKDKEEVKHEEEILHVKSTHAQELHVLNKLIPEYRIKIQCRTYGRVRQVSRIAKHNDCSTGRLGEAS